LSEDPFKDELEKIARDAQERHERENLQRKKRGREFRDNVEDMFKTVVAFNARVIAPVLAEFSAGAPGAGGFDCEFNESESQPEFIHVCELHGQRLTVSLLYWIAGSAQLNCGFGYTPRDEPFKIDSFHETDLDERTRSWLKARLLERYRAHMERTRHFNDESA
jgi:hypothetical protein